MNDRSAHQRQAFAALIGLALLVAACNFPLAANPQDVYGTAAAQTVSAQLTQAFAASPTAPALPATATDTPSPTTPPASPTPAPSATNTPGCTDISTFVSDVTIPDNTSKSPGAAFEKTWRLRNTGSCTWTGEYDIVFIDGNIMGGPSSAPLPGTIAPGSTVDVSVDLVAPAGNGTHKGNWRLRNDKGVLFGVTFYVQIIVGPTPTSAPAVYKADKMTVDSSYNFDLDDGDPTASSGDKDGWYNAVSAAEQYLDPVNGAEFKRWGNSVPSYSDCKNASLSGDPISFDDLPVNTYVCYQTNEGRYGRFQIEDKTTYTVDIDFRTWKKE
ncbi:MAG TPA: NBR1-Ig-like domain-containing protein [Anaerolineales bacterium]|nr:NBR1-Ig-like domain-containing protein [Anaerolineales bacterium]